MPDVASRRQRLRQLPWRLVRTGLRLLRRGYFSQPRPHGEYLHVADSATNRDVVEAVTAALGRRHFHPNWEVSAYYQDEILNLARAEYAPVDDVEWFQTHLRGWREDGGVSLKAHREAAPTEHPRQHLDPQYHDPDAGMATLRSVLDDAGISYTTFEYR